MRQQRTLPGAPLHLARLRSFKPTILAHDPVINAERIQALGCESVALDDLFSRSADLTTALTLRGEHVPTRGNGVS